jgi:hypothetical protein
LTWYRRIAAGSRCLSATGIRFLSTLSRSGIPPLSRSAYQARRPGPRRGFHVPRIRHTAGGGRPLNPEASGVHTVGILAPTAARRLFQRPGPTTLVFNPSSRA